MLRTTVRGRRGGFLNYRQILTLEASIEARQSRITPFFTIVGIGRAGAGLLVHITWGRDGGVNRRSKGLACGPSMARPSDIDIEVDLFSPRLLPYLQAVGKVTPVLLQPCACYDHSPLDDTFSLSRGMSSIMQAPRRKFGGFRNPVISTKRQVRRSARLLRGNF